MSRLDIKDIIKKVKQIEIRSRRETDASLMGAYHSAFKGQGMTFAEIRPYQFGDEIRRIDWNKTARFQQPFVKVMEECFWWIYRHLWTMERKFH